MNKDLRMAWDEIIYLHNIQHFPCVNRHEVSKALLRAVEKCFKIYKDMLQRGL